MAAVAADIAIIIVAMETIVINILLAILVIQIMRLIRLLQEEVLPIISSTQEQCAARRRSLATTWYSRLSRSTAMQPAYVRVCGYYLVSGSSQDSVRRSKWLTLQGTLSWAF